MQTSQYSVHGNLLDFLIFSSFEILLCKQTLNLIKHEIFYEVELSVTQNLLWKQISCKINLGGPLYPIFHFKVLSLVLITEKKDQNGKKIQLTEQSCVLNEIRIR